ncbi:MAG TPA: GWxTD domain-containing protein, partial [Gemmatimonadales bacterium]|nr:GWxTD domain-containing protein [Gemmatimonadales bacterium]
MCRAFPRPGWALFAAVLLTAPLVSSRLLSAQSPAERIALDSLRDSLALIPDSVALHQLEAQWISVARVDRNNTMLHLRLGILGLRLAALGRRDGYDDAGTEFQWAADLEPTWPWPWYGLGLSEYGTLDSEVSLVAGIQAMFGKDRLTKAAGMFAKSAEVDPSFVHGLTELANTALEQRMNLRLAVALVALRRAAATPAARHPDVLLARGRIEREVGDADSSAAAFRLFLTAGGDPNLGRVELARTLLSGGDLTGGEPYFAAAGSNDRWVDSLLRADLHELVADSELVGLDSLHGDARSEWLKDFWAKRDQGDLRHPGERLAEHYRRMWYARRNFRLVSPRRQYRIEERYRSYSRDYDDRGLIYIRHGEPTERAALAGHSLPLNQSWRYSRPEGDLLFHFVAREDVQDYKLVESVYDILGFDAAVSLRSNTAPDSVRVAAVDLIQSRLALSPLYGQLLATGGAGSMGVIDRERMAGRQSIAVGTKTDSYGLRFGTTLEEARWEVIAAGQSAGRSLVHLVWAVPSKSLRPVMSGRGILYPVRIRFALSQATTGRLVASVDSTTLFVSQTEVPHGEWLVGRIEVPVPPGTYTWRVAVQEAEAGLVSPPDTVAVGAEDRLGVSDLVLGVATSNLRWLRSDEDTVYFNPAGAYRANSPLQLFFEVLGVKPGESYKTEIKVVRPGGLGPIGRFFRGGGGGISVRNQEVATGTRIAVARELDLGRLRPGTYSLEVTVEQGGRKVRRRSPFQV